MSLATRRRGWKHGATAINVTTASRAVRVGHARRVQGRMARRREEMRGRGRVSPAASPGFGCLGLLSGPVLGAGSLRAMLRSEQLSCVGCSAARFEKWLDAQVPCLRLGDRGGNLCEALRGPCPSKTTMAHRAHDRRSWQQCRTLGTVARNGTSHARWPCRAHQAHGHCGHSNCCGRGRTGCGMCGRGGGGRAGLRVSARQGLFAKELGYTGEEASRLGPRRTAMCQSSPS